MEHIFLPTHVEYAKGAHEHESVITIEPLYAGYGLTIGNALRRVLLSSLSGGAIISVKIKGVDHEFSTIPYVKEDVVDILLNLKKLRFRVHSDEPVKLWLRAKGEKDVTGADIESNSEAEIVNTEAHICSLTNRNAQFEMELTVRKGRGYQPTEMRDREKVEAGSIMVDAIFTPVRSVGLRTENTRVGQMTNFNKVVLTVQTDGTVTPREAFEDAVGILIQQFKTLTGIASETDGDSATAADTAMTPEEIGATLDTDGAMMQDADEETGAKKKRGRPKKNEE